MTYECLRCGYSTNLKANFKKHLKRKVMCPPKIKNVTIKHVIKHYGLNKYINKNNMGSSKNKIAIENVLNHKCKFCKKIFKSAPSKSRHQLYYCKKKDTLMDKERMQNLVTKLSLQVKELMEETNLGTIDMASMYNNKQIANRINNNQQINMQHNNNQMINNIDNSKNVNIHNYGDEDISHITDQQYKDMLENPYSALSKLMNAIHFNDEKPENQNMRIPNIKQPFAEVFKDGEWVVSNQYKLLCKAYSVKKEILHQAFLRIQNQLDEKTKQLYYEYRKAAEDDLFTVQSQLTDLKAAIISGTRHKEPVPSRYALRQTCQYRKDIISIPGIT